MPVQNHMLIKKNSTLQKTNQPNNTDKQNTGSTSASNISTSEIQMPKNTSIIPTVVKKDPITTCR